MKKNSLLLAIFAFSISIHAQSIKLAVGKKFGVTTETKLTTKASAMGQEMEIGNSIINTSVFELKAFTNNGFTVSNTLKRMKVSASVMGQEQSFDSEDSAARNNPQYGQAFAMLNKPYDIEIENKKATYRGEIGENISQMGGVPGIVNDQAKLILTQQDMLKLKEGNQWTDSLISSDSNKVVYEYTVIKINATIAEILVKAVIQVNLTVKQMGMEIKQSLKGTSNGIRQYNAATGLLLKEDSDIAISGNMEVMGQSSPMNISGKITTTVAP